MNKFSKYALAAALVIPSVFALGGKEAKADSLTINKDVAGAVNVRSSAAETNNIIGLIDDENKTYEILGRENGWFRINFEGNEAYVGTPWFNVRKETSVLSPTNFRSEPNLGSEVIEVLESGKTVTTLEDSQNGFVKVDVDGVVGYIYHNLLESYRAKQVPVKPQANTSTSQQTSYNQAPANDYYYEEEVYYEEPANNYYQEEETSYQGDSNWAKEWIAQRESGGSYTAYNPAGGYYGRYQLNPSLISYGASPAEQEAAADAYVYQRYGSWENAQAFWANNGWY
ncbi:MAG: SH3 domain-containing protein [Anaerococcus sp.]|nr:SH3 domain-containing protein [Anaerococcus sp.]